MMAFAWEVTCYTHAYTMSLYTAKVLILLQYIVVHSMVSDTCIFHDSDSDRGHFVAG